VAYAGGEQPWPTYKRIGDHTEAIVVEFDPTVTSYPEILDRFFSLHSPFYPSFNRQYRSAILYHSEDQRVAAEAAVEALSKGSRRAYTAVEPLKEVYRAEEYHQKFFAKESARRRG